MKIKLQSQISRFHSITRSLSDDRQHLACPTRASCGTTCSSSNTSSMPGAVVHCGMMGSFSKSPVDPTFKLTPCLHAAQNLPKVRGKLCIIPVSKSFEVFRISFWHAETSLQWLLAHEITTCCRTSFKGNKPAQIIQWYSMNLPETLLIQGRGQ